MGLFLGIRCTAAAVCIKGNIILPQQFDRDLSGDSTAAPFDFIIIGAAGCQIINDPEVQIRRGNIVMIRKLIALRIIQIAMGVAGHRRFKHIRCRFGRGKGEIVFTVFVGNGHTGTC